MGNHVRQVTTGSPRLSARSPPPAGRCRHDRYGRLGRTRQLRCRRDGPGPPEQTGATPSTRSTATRCPSSLCRTRSRGRDIDRTVRGRPRVPVDFVYTNCPDGVCPALILRLAGRRVRCRKRDSATRRRSSRSPSTQKRHVPSPPRIRRSADASIRPGNWHFLSVPRATRRARN